MSQRNVPTASARARRTPMSSPCEGDETTAELEFLKAMDAYKREHHRPFPTWREVLGVLVSLGYRKASAE